MYSTMSACPTVVLGKRAERLKNLTTLSRDWKTYELNYYSFVSLYIPICSRSMKIRKCIIYRAETRLI